jgi:hypothetical protein
VQRRQRLLRDEGDAPSKQRAPRLAVQRQQVRGLEQHAPFGDFEARRRVAGDDTANHALAGAGLTDQAQNPAARQRKRQIAQQIDLPSVDVGA